MHISASVYAINNKLFYTREIFISLQLYERNMFFIPQNPLKNQTWTCYWQVTYFFFFSSFFLNWSASPINLISALPLYDVTGYERNLSVRSTREASAVYFRNKIILSRSEQKCGMSISFLFFLRLGRYNGYKNLDAAKTAARGAAWCRRDIIFKEMHRILWIFPYKENVYHACIYLLYYSRGIPDAA